MKLDPKLRPGSRKGLRLYPPSRQLSQQHHHRGRSVPIPRHNHSPLQVLPELLRTDPPARIVRFFNPPNFDHRPVPAQPQSRLPIRPRSPHNEMIRPANQYPNHHIPRPFPQNWLRSLNSHPCPPSRKIGFVPPILPSLPQRISASSLCGLRGESKARPTANWLRSLNSHSCPPIRKIGFVPPILPSLPQRISASSLCDLRGESQARPTANWLRSLNSRSCPPLAKLASFRQFFQAFLSGSPRLLSAISAVNPKPGPQQIGFVPSIPTSALPLPKLASFRQFFPAFLSGSPRLLSAISAVNPKPGPKQIGFVPSIPTSALPLPKLASFRQPPQPVPLLRASSASPRLRVESTANPRFFPANPPFFPAAHPILTILYRFPTLKVYPSNEARTMSSSTQYHRDLCESGV